MEKKKLLSIALICFIGLLHPGMGFSTQYVLCIAEGDHVALEMKAEGSRHKSGPAPCSETFHQTIGKSGNISPCSDTKECSDIRVIDNPIRNSSSSGDITSGKPVAPQPAIIDEHADYFEKTGRPWEDTSPPAQNPVLSSVKSTVLIL